MVSGDILIMICTLVVLDFHGLRIFDFLLIAGVLGTGMQDCLLVVDF